MNIHHNTLKRAASLGLRMAIDHAGRTTVSGEIFPGVESDWYFSNADAKEVLQSVYQARVYAKEYKLEVKQTPLGVFAVTIPGGQHVRGDDLLDVLTKAVEKATSRQKAETSVKIDTAKKPAKKAAPKKIVQEVEEADDEDEEVSSSGSVVKDKYRSKYIEAGHPLDCGDDLAAQLATVLKSADKLDIDRLWKLAQLNGIEYTKYMTGNRGWEGRARMSIGNVLRGRIRRGEEVVLEV